MVGVACQGMGLLHGGLARIICLISETVFGDLFSSKEIRFVGNGNLESDFQEAEKEFLLGKYLSKNTYNVTLNIANLVS